MEVTGEVRAGERPFFYVVDLLRPASFDLVVPLGELFAQRKIEGGYCNEKQRALLIKHNVPVKVGAIRPIHHGYQVDIVATTPRDIGFGAIGEESCEKVVRAPDGRSVVVEVKAETPTELASHLRLAGNMMWMRWDPRAPENQQLFGEPLV